MRTPRFLFLLTTLFFLNSCSKDDDSGDVGIITTLETPTDGQISLSTYTGNYGSDSRLLLLDKNGNTQYKKEIPVAAINFRKWQTNGTTRYTYQLYDSTAFKITTNGSIIPCTGVILNENFQEIKRVRLLPFNGRNANDPTAIDSHEFIYIDDNHYITLSYFQKPVNNIPASLRPVSNCQVVASIIQEVVNNTVVFEWDGTNYPEFYQQSVEGNAFNNPAVVHDYMHMNSIFIDPTDNNLICSMRNTNQIVKISRLTGSVIWRLGGTNSNFVLSADKIFLRQHDATLVDNNRTLLLFDNGDSKLRPYSRVMEVYFNTTQTAIDSTKVFNIPGNLFCQYMGSVQKRGDTYFVGCGSTPKIMEVNYKTNKVNFLMDLAYVCYRAYKE